MFLYQDACTWLKVRTHARKDAYTTSCTQLDPEKGWIHVLIVWSDYFDIFHVYFILFEFDYVRIRLIDLFFFWVFLFLITFDMFRIDVSLFNGWFYFCLILFFINWYLNCIFDGRLIWICFLLHYGVIWYLPYLF